MAQPFVIRHAAGLVTLVLLITSLLPFRHLVWLDGPSHLVSIATAPIKEPLRRLGSWLAGTGPAATSEGVQEIEMDRDRFKRWYFQQLARTRDLERRISELERGRSFGSLEVDLLTRRVTGASSDLSTSVFEVRAGSRDGVTVNCVAVVSATQLVGRVVDVGAVTCDVRPFTDRAAGAISGAIVVDEDENIGEHTLLPVLLKPDGRGGLRGEVASVGPSPTRQTPPVPQRGLEVRLLDDAWPASAQMLTIGTIERVDNDPEQPLRFIVSVTPRVDPRRLSEVTIRIPREEGEPSEDQE